LFVWHNGHHSQHHNHLHFHSRYHHNHRQRDHTLLKVNNKPYSDYGQQLHFCHIFSNLFQLSWPDNSGSLSFLENNINSLFSSVKFYLKLLLAYSFAPGTFFLDLETAYIVFALCQFIFYDCFEFTLGF